MFITKRSLSRRAVLKGMGATLTLPFLDAMVPAATALAKTAAQPGAPVRRRVRADGRAARLLDAADHGVRVRVHADPEADREIPRQPRHRVEPGSSAGRHARGQHLDVAHRIGAQAHRGRGLLRRHLARPGGRRPDRQGHGVPVARNRHRGSGGIHRRVRRGLQLRLHEHDRLAGADHAAADGNQSARRVRADVRASGHRGGSHGPHEGRSEHPRLGAPRRGVARARARAARSHAVERVSRARARGRAAHSARREAGVGNARRAGGAGRRAGVVRRARRPHVRSDGGGV